SLAGLQPYTGSFGAVELKHLLNRTMFGYKMSDLATLSGKTMAQVVATLLTEASKPLPPINDYSANGANFADPNVALGQNWVTAPNDGNINAYRAVSYKNWWVQTLVGQGTSIHEKMILFWQNHFATELMVIGDPRFAYKHHELVRTNALGNFRTLTREMTYDPAMLVYLNGNQNSVAAPDENYGRELQELFTSGKGAGSKYTEDDVKAAAKVLTGWRSSTANLNSFFDSKKHESRDKTFSSYYGNKVIKGKTGNNAGIDELNEMLDMIFSVDEVAKHLCRKLYRFFVYYVITDDIETNVITPMADTFRSNNYEIKPVLNQLFTSSHFYDVVNQACQIKAPLDLIIGYLKHMNVALPDKTSYTQSYAHYGLLAQYSSILQQDLHDQPSVAGWPAYYQEPAYYELWINTDTLQKRNQFSDLLVYTGYVKSGFTTKADVIAVTKQFSKPADPNKLIEEAINYLFPLNAGPSLAVSLKYILLSGQSSDYYWTDAWEDYLAKPNDAMLKSAVVTRLTQFFGYIMSQSEYQLC
ncbi:MAG: DUF1800 domain-containing protein, partial [Bacteroidota bacterium]|nr:DUF1800 domain-containing protein [Bacteroidota bacterium]